MYVHIRIHMCIRTYVHDRCYTKLNGEATFSICDVPLLCEWRTANQFQVYSVFPKEQKYCSTLCCSGASLKGHLYKDTSLIRTVSEVPIVYFCVQISL